MSNQEKLYTVLNQTVADLSQTSALIHQVHWYMRGPGFLYLHPLMDTLRADIEELTDEFAERLITIGGSPVSTLAEFAETSAVNLQPTKWGVPTKSRLSELVEAYTYLSTLLKRGVAISQECDDVATEDLYTGALREVEKTLWMLNSEVAE